MDLKVMEILDILPVTSVDIDSPAPLILRLKGRNYHYAQQVNINDAALTLVATADEVGFRILDKYTILARMPEYMWDKLINTIHVFGEKTGLQESTSISLNFTSFASVRGIAKAVQQYVFVLMTTPGSDKFFPSRGGGLNNMVGAAINAANAQGLAAALSDCLKRTLSSLKKTQSYANLPPEEKILDVILLSLGYDSLSTAVNIDLEFRTEVERAVVKVGV